jgi:hypothetical protein
MSEKEAETNLQTSIGFAPWSCALFLQQRMQMLLQHGCLMSAHTPQVKNKLCLNALVITIMEASICERFIEQCA